MTSKASSLQSVSPPLSSLLPSSALPLVSFSFLDGAKPGAACVRGTGPLGSAIGRNLRSGLGARRFQAGHEEGTQSRDCQIRTHSDRMGHGGERSQRHGWDTDRGSEWG